MIFTSLDPQSHYYGTFSLIPTAHAYNSSLLHAVVRGSYHEPQSSPRRTDRTLPDIGMRRHGIHRLFHALRSPDLPDRHLLAHPHRCGTDGRTEAARTSAIPQRTAGIKTTSPVALATVAAAILRSINTPAA